MASSGKPTGALPNPYAKALPNPYAAATVAESGPTKASEEQAKAEQKKLPGIYLSRTLCKPLFTTYAIL
jgi:splicing factor 45